METEYFNLKENSVREMNITLSYLNNDKRYILIKLSGFLDTYNSGDFTSSILRFLALEKRLITTIDLERVNYISSTGIGSMVEINKYCVKEKIKLYLKGMQPNVVEVFRLLGFYGFFDYIDKLSDIKEEKIHRAMFPAMIECPYCNKKFKIQKPGKFKCPDCLNSFRISVENNKINIEKRE